MTVKKTPARKPAARKKNTPKPAPSTPPPPPAAPKTRTGHVALIGRPNVGKSTLLNRLLGQKVAIVSDKPQTTRISLLGIKSTEQGQVIFIDNPGIHKPLHKLNKRMMSYVDSALETADVVCLLVDAALRFGHGDTFVLEMLRRVTKPVFLLINKVDAVRKGKILLLIDAYKDLYPFREIIPISALKGTNVDALEKCLAAHLPAAERIFPEGELSDQSERFLLAELIREKLLARVEKELPYVTAVYIDRVERRGAGEGFSPAVAEDEGGEEAAPGERPAPGPRHPIHSGLPIPPPDGWKRRTKDGLRRRDLPVTYVQASIFVERDNHRQIIIGREGRVIKGIGVEARRDMEKYLGTRVYLDLMVKVRPNWRDSADVLDLIEGQK